MKKYAERIGVDYLFKKNPTFAIAPDKWSKWVSQYYNCFEPCFNPELYENYDNILYVDCDVGVPPFVTENVFEEMGSDFDLCMCREREQEHARLKQSIHGLKELQGPRSATPLRLREVHYYSDEKWIDLVENHYDIDVSRNEKGIKKLYNSGVIIYTQQGMKRAREEWLPIDEYLDVVEPMRPTDYYLTDQLYLIAMLDKIEMKVKDLGEDWNSRVCNYGPMYDCRTPTSKFIHVQSEMGCAKCQEEKLYDVLWNKRNYDPWKDLV